MSNTSSQMSVQGIRRPRHPAFIWFAHSLLVCGTAHRPYKSPSRRPLKCKLFHRQSQAIGAELHGNS